MQAVRKKLTTLKSKLEEAEFAAAEAEDELLDTNQKGDAAEESVNDLTTELSSLEDELDETESKLVALQEKLLEAEKGTDEHSQAKKILEHRGQSDGSRISRLEAELAELTSQNEAVVEEYDQLVEAVSNLEAELDGEEERCEEHDLKVKGYEVEVTQLGNSLRSMEMNEGQANERTESGDHKIEDKSEKLQDMEVKAADYEEKTKQYEEDLDELELELNSRKDEFTKAKHDLDSLLAEINDM